MNIDISSYKTKKTSINFSDNSYFFSEPTVNEFLEINSLIKEFGESKGDFSKIIDIFLILAENKENLKENLEKLPISSLIVLQKDLFNSLGLGQTPQEKPGEKK